MPSDVDNDSSQCGMPVGHSFFKNGRVRYRLDMISFVVPVEHPEVIAALTPEPLVYDDHSISIVLARGTGLLEGFGEGDLPWDEVIIKWLVTHRGGEGHYNFANYVNNSFVAISARELFGQPKIPARIVVEKSGNDFKARISSLSNDHDLLELAFAADGETPAGAIPPAAAARSRTTVPDRKPGLAAGPVGAMPSIINLKHIPSAVLGNAPDVRQLVKMEYGKPVIRTRRPGNGEIHLLEDAPRCLTEAGLCNIESALYLDIELDIRGGRILYDYTKQE